MSCIYQLLQLPDICLAAVQHLLTDLLQLLGRSPSSDKVLNHAFLYLGVSVKWRSNMSQMLDMFLKR